mgnify:CR=1 FL=1
MIPIGGGDMPVVISLLNSFSGIAAAFAGLLLLNNVLIVAGSLVGASGLILTIIMAKAMNRSIGNILFVGYSSSSSSDVTACDNYFWNGELYTVSGEYVYNTTTVAGCDSVASLN